MKKLLFFLLMFLALSHIIMGQTDSLHCSPNPFSDSTTIQYSLANEDTFTITIYNIIGKIMYRPFKDSVILPGTYSFILHSSNYPDGKYFAVLNNRIKILHQIYIVKSGGSGISYLDTPKKLKIYPNPTANSITIESNIKIERVKIYSLNGLLIMDIKDPKPEINFSDLPAADYILIGINKGENNNQ